MHKPGEKYLNILTTRASQFSKKFRVGSYLADELVVKSKSRPGGDKRGGLWPKEK